MRLGIRLVLVLALTLAAFAVSAQTQRMAIPPGSYTVGGGDAGGGGSTTIRAFCVDRHRSTPSGGMISVLGPSGTSTVTRLSDGETLPLAQAMSNGWIQFEGHSVREVQASTTGSGQYRIDIEQSIALSQQTNEITSDILGTLTWLDEQDTIGALAVSDVWDFREANATETLGASVEFAQYFDSVEALFELQSRVDEAGTGTVALLHVDEGDESYDRLILSPGEDILRFSGPNADRRFLEEFRSPGEQMIVWIAEPQSLEQAQPFSTAANTKLRELEDAYWEAPANSEEEARALEDYNALRDRIVDTTVTAVKVGLLSADEETIAGAQTLTVTDAPVPTATGAGGSGAIVVRGGVIAAFDGDPPTGAIDGHGGGSVPPVARSALDSDDGRPRRVGTTQQADSIWTSWVEGTSQLKVDRVFASVFSFLRAAVARDATPKEVVSSVEQAIQFNERAYQAFPQVGEVDVRLFLDADELLNIRVAAIKTDVGIRFARLSRHAEQGHSR